MTRLSKRNDTKPLPAKMTPAKMVMNALLSRLAFFQQLFDRRRNLDDECGYPDSSAPVPPEKYQELFEREPIAARVVECLAKESWQVQPSVTEVERGDKITEFESRWIHVGRQLRSAGQKSWYKDQLGSVIWEYLCRADELSGIGTYGVILLGLDDCSQESGVDLRHPCIPKKYIPGQGGRNLLYIRCFPEKLARINSFENNRGSPRFGQPLTYEITFNDPRETGAGSTGAAMTTQTVHWTRVVHIADTHHQASTSEIFAVPRQRPVLNPILDIRKVRGSSAEMYYKGAFPGSSIETMPQLGSEIDIDEEKTRDMLEEYRNGLQRDIILEGLTMKDHAPQVVDPTPQINVHIEAICIKLGIPIRIFKGSERGELASTQDDDAWNDRLIQRQDKYITPRIIAPFIDRLIVLGVLPEPSGYAIEWPSLTSQSDSQRADVLLKRVQAYGQYISTNLQSVVPPLDFMTRFDDMDEEEANAILTAAAGIAEGDPAMGVQDTASPLLGLVGGITGMLDIFQKAKDGALNPEQMQQLIQLFYKVDAQTAADIVAGGVPVETEPTTPVTPEGTV